MCCCHAPFSPLTSGLAYWLTSGLASTSGTPGSSSPGSGCRSGHLAAKSSQQSPCTSHRESQEQKYWPPEKGLGGHDTAAVTGAGRAVQGDIWIFHRKSLVHVVQAPAAIFIAWRDFGHSWGHVNAKETDPTEQKQQSAAAHCANPHRSAVACTRSVDVSECKKLRQFAGY